MPTVLPFSQKLLSKIKHHQLEKKLAKQCFLLVSNPLHPSLNLELLEPKNRGIYSFRIDQKFRALCVFNSTKNIIEVFAVTNHYH